MNGEKEKIFTVLGGKNIIVEERRWGKNILSWGKYKHRVKIQLNVQTKKSLINIYKNTNRTSKKKHQDSVNVANNDNIKIMTHSLYTSIFIFLS